MFMAVNKVVYGSTTLVDLTADTVTADALAKGVTAHDKAGNLLTGTAETTVTNNILHIPFGSVSGNTLEV